MEHSRSISRGFAALLGVIVIGSVAMTIAGAVFFESVRFIRASRSIIEGDRAREAARACAELALSAIQQDIAYTGIDTQTIDSATCTYDVTEPASGQKHIESTGQFEENIHRLTIEVDAVSPNVHVASWRDVVSF